MFTCIQMRATRRNGRKSLALNASSVTGFSGGTYLSTDECDRFWLSLQSHGIWIFDSQGSHLGTLNITGVSMYDTLIDKNYVMYISDYASNRIIRIEIHTFNADWHEQLFSFTFRCPVLSCVN